MPYGVKGDTSDSRCTSLWHRWCRPLTFNSVNRFGWSDVKRFMGCPIPLEALLIAELACSDA